MVIYQSGSGHLEGDDSVPTSIVRVDDKGSEDAPSSEVDYFDSERLTAVTGDASDAYRTANPEKDCPKEVMPYTFNGKHSFHLGIGWADMKHGNLPDWYFSQKQNREWSLVHPSARAFRTAALIRSKSTASGSTSGYVLIADDIQMDDKSHDYRWRMMIADDLKDHVRHGTDEVVYSSPDGKSGLLVRLLACNAPTRFETDNEDPYVKRPWLDITTRSVAPGYKVLLYPFKTGSPLPKTSWNGDLLTIDHGGGTIDRVAFTKDPAGWTKIRMVDEQP